MAKRTQDIVGTYSDFTEWHVFLIENKPTHSFLSVSATKLITNLRTSTLAKESLRYLQVSAPITTEDDSCRAPNFLKSHFVV